MKNLTEKQSVDIDKLIKDYYNSYDLVKYEISEDDCMLMLKKSTLKSMIESVLNSNQ